MLNIFNIFKKERAKYRFIKEPIYIYKNAFEHSSDYTPMIIEFNGCLIDYEKLKNTFFEIKQPKLPILLRNLESNINEIEKVVELLPISGNFRLDYKNVIHALKNFNIREYFNDWTMNNKDIKYFAWFMHEYGNVLLKKYKKNRTYYKINDDLQYENWIGLFKNAIDLEYWVYEKTLNRIIDMLYEKPKFVRLEKNFVYRNEDETFYDNIYIFPYIPLFVGKYVNRYRTEKNEKYKKCTEDNYITLLQKAII